MKCPFCQVEMMHGYLNCGHAIWSERKHKVSLLPDGSEKYALRLRQPALSPNHIESDYCPGCKRLVISAAEYETNIGD